MQICTDWFPAADAASDLDLIGVIPAAYPKTFVPVKNFTFDVNFFVFAGDKLVYQCIENQVERLTFSVSLGNLLRKVALLVELRIKKIIGHILLKVSIENTALNRMN